jgi:hypothetical protein
VLLAGRGETLGEHHVQVLADGGGTESQRAADLRGGGPAVLQQVRLDPRPRPAVAGGKRGVRTGCVFHNGNVT